MNSHRQGRTEVSLTYPDGGPLARRAVRIRQTRRAFPFGLALTHRMLAEAPLAGFVVPRFTWATFGNESKWYANEKVRGSEDYREADELLDWCEAHRLEARGHCVFWEPESWQPDWVRGLADGDLRGAVERRLESAVAHFRGRFRHWDVNNETLHGSFFRDRLGAEIWPWMFRRVRELDPDVRLFANEFNVLSVDQNFAQVQTAEYVAHVRELIEQGAPIDAVGIQGHVWREDLLANPGVVTERLDLVAELGLPIWITEYDAADEDPERNADILELVYRTAFGHSAVEGIVTWTPWAGDSWRGPNAALAEADWTLRPAGRRLDALLAEWTTDYETVTDGAGWVLTEGYAGSYVAEADGLSVPFEILATRSAPG
ncbi:MAG: endo-1,4-beta-xylanase [Fimbriimonadaceae bacterium]|nr:endo-1,4-beta-xylanase [Fimbriimonadaceae bacterium]